MSADDVMLFVRWLLEQGVWAAPIAFGVLYLHWPKRQRGPWLTAVKYAFVALFVANVAGVYPGPARVSCSLDTFATVCIERTAGASAPAGSVGAGLRSTGTDSRTARPDGSAEVEVERPLSPPLTGGGSLNRAGAATVAGRCATPARPTSPRLPRPWR